MRRDFRWFPVFLGLNRVFAVVVVAIGLWQLAELISANSYMQSSQVGFAKGIRFSPAEVGTGAQALFGLVVGAFVALRSRWLAVWQLARPVQTHRSSIAQVALALARMVLMVAALLYVRRAVAGMASVVYASNLEGVDQSLSRVPWEVTASLIWNAMLTIGLLILLVFSGRLWRWIMAGFESRCPKCAYELPNAESRCPECGTAMAIASSTES